jgi:hypothetical protein
VLLVSYETVLKDKARLRNIPFRVGERKG